MTKTLKLFKAAAIVMASPFLFEAADLSADAQVDTAKHWYTTYMKATMPVDPRQGGCATASIKFVFAPNMRANQLSSPPAGYTKAYDNSKPGLTRSSGGWCPKSMTANACEAREKARATNVWRNWTVPYSCATVWWNNSTIISK